MCRSIFTNSSRKEELVSVHCTLLGRLFLRKVLEDHSQVNGLSLELAKKTSVDCNNEQIKFFPLRFDLIVILMRDSERKDKKPESSELDKRDLGVEEEQRAAAATSTTTAH